MMVKAGILSDTHLNSPEPLFRQLVERCFSDCEVIIHAGDLTDLSVLDPFAGKTIHAVCGNMCRGTARTSLERSKIFRLGAFTIGLTHGAGLGYDIESGLWELFPEVDCMVYGHTHRPVCHRVGGTLVINPGSFRSTGRWGAAGTYALLEAGKTLQARIHQVPQL
ncbi:MAG TPA: YfcE family phosphodiesterase [Desulfobulbus sp.]|nr:YfcE family phosphodiesterase [Desulfobulbus sp.]